MKKNILIISILFVFAACKQRPEGVEIAGSFTNSNKEKVLLEELGFQQSTSRDSTVLNEDGNFELLADIRDKGFYRLSLNPNNFIILILDSGETVKVTGDAQNLAETYTVSGSRDSELLWELNNTFKNNYRKRDSLQNVFQENMYHPQADSIGKVLEAQYEASVNELTNYVKSFIDNNPGSFATLAALEHLNPNTDFDYFKKVSNNLKERYPESPYVKALVSRVESMEQTAMGAIAPEIALRSPEGEIITLSSLRGNVVMIDFWASWCKPCRQENPNIVRMYNKFKDKGFEILGVSLDDNEQAWKNAIKEDGLTWKQVSDLQGRESKVAALYQVSGIPYTVLLDREGRIIAKGLRGQELEERIEEEL